MKEKFLNLTIGQNFVESGRTDFLMLTSAAALPRQGFAQNVEFLIFNFLYFLVLVQKER